MAGRFLDFLTTVNIELSKPRSRVASSTSAAATPSLVCNEKFMMEKLVKRFFRTILRGSTSLWLVDPPVKGWISIDRSLVAALPSTIPWPVLKSSTNGSAIPKPCVTQRLCYPSLRAMAWYSHDCGSTRFEGLISGRLSTPGMWCPLHRCRSSTR